MLAIYESQSASGLDMGLGNRVRSFASAVVFRCCCWRAGGMSNLSMNYQFLGRSGLRVTAPAAAAGDMRPINYRFL
jgi:hypothetical protein